MKSPLLLLVPLLLQACPSHAEISQQFESSQQASIQQPVAPKATPIITFLVASDTHYGIEQWSNNEATNKQAIGLMNGLEGAAWPASVVSGTVENIRGVLMPGDLTDSGTSDNWYGYWFFGHTDGFVDDFQVHGASSGSRLHYDVYEGYGNHDIHSPATGVVKNQIKSRTLLRNDVVNVSNNGLHYSFDWGRVHLVNLNLYPGGSGDAEDSLAFLIQDLASQVGDSNKPIVLYHHYGFDPFGLSWWTNAERDAYLAAISGYNVIAIFNGHNHSPSHRFWNGIAVFNAPHLKALKFLAVRITGNKLSVAVRNGSVWGTVWNVTF